MWPAALEETRDAAAARLLGTRSDRTPLPRSEVAAGVRADLARVLAGATAGDVVACVGMRTASGEGRGGGWNPAASSGGACAWWRQAGA